jgi:hypothetical protein
MLFRTSRKINAVGIDNHTELSVFKAEVRATLAQFGGSDEEWQLRAEILVVTITVAVTLFVISKLGFFAGLALTLFCAAMFCVAYARPFLRFTGGTNTPIPLRERLVTAAVKILEGVLLTVDALRDRPNTRQTD